MTRIEYWKNPNEDTAEKFLAIFEKMSESTATNLGKTTQNRIDQHEVFIKFVFTVASISTLLDGSRISRADLRKSFLDYASIAVLVRSAFEGYLTYFYIFADKVDEDTKTFRYLNWVLDGLMQRQRIDATSSKELEKKKDEEAKQIMAYSEKAKATKEYGKLTEKEKNRLSKTWEFRRDGWADIGILTGMTPYWAKIFYGFLSSYAHSGSGSIMQFKEATVQKDQGINDMVMKFLFSICAKIAHVYSADFGHSHLLDYNENEFLEAWLFLADNMKKAG